MRTLFVIISSLLFNTCTTTRTVEVPIPVDVRRPCAMSTPPEPARIETTVEGCPPMLICLSQTSYTKLVLQSRSVRNWIGETVALCGPRAIDGGFTFTDGG